MFILKSSAASLSSSLFLQLSLHLCVFSFTSQASLSCENKASRFTLQLQLQDNKKLYTSNYFPSCDLWFRIYSPAPSPTGGDPKDVVGMLVIVFFHAGGYILGQANSISVDKQACKFARELRAIVFSVNYRLAPKHRFPSQYEEGFDALRFIDEMDGRDLPPNADLNRCFIAGESAGGNLAHFVAVRAGEYGFKRVNLLGLIAVQPFFGGEERVEFENRLFWGPTLTLDGTDWYWRAFLPEGSNRDHPAANVFGPNAGEISGVRFPAMLVVIGGFDLLRDWDISWTAC